MYHADLFLVLPTLALGAPHSWILARVCSSYYQPHYEQELQQHKSIKETRVYGSRITLVRKLRVPSLVGRPTTSVFGTLVRICIAEKEMGNPTESEGEREPSS